MRRSLHTLAADLHQIIKRHEPAPFWSHAWLGLPHAPNSAPFSSAGDGRGGSNYKGRIQHPRKGPKSRLAALPSQQDRALSQQSPQGLQRMLSSFPAKLTPVHVHSVLAWAIDHYEQQGAVRVRKASAEIGHVPSSMPQSVAMPLRDGRAAQGNGSAQLQQKEHGLMEDILRDLVLKLNGFQRWDQHLLQACNRLATHPAAPPRVRAHATTLTAAAVRQVLIDRSWGQGQVQAMATLVSNSLATLSHDSEPQRHAATLRDALDGLPALIPLMNIVPSWRTALILTQLELPHIPTFKAIASRFKYPEILGNLSAKELALLGHAFALVGARSEGLFDLMSKLLGYNNKLDQMNWKDISMLAWALYRLDLKSSPLLSTLASAVNHLSSTATAAVPQQQIMAPPPPSTPPPPSPLSRDSFGGHHYGPANSSESPVHPIHIAASAQPLNPTSPAPTLSNPPGFLHMERLEHTTGTHAWNHGFPCVETAQGRAQHLPSLSNSVRTTHERAQLPISPTHLLSLSRHCLKLRSRHARPLAAALCNVGAAVMAGNLQMVPCEAGDAPRRTSCTQYQGREFTQGGQALREWQRRETYGGGGMQQEGPSVRMSKLGWRGTEEGILEPRLIVLLLSTAVFYRVHNPELLSRGLQALEHCPPQQIEQQLQLPQMVHLLWVLAQISTNSSSPAAPHPTQSKAHLRTEGFEQLYTQNTDPPLSGASFGRHDSPGGLSFSHAGSPMDSEGRQCRQEQSRGAAEGGAHVQHAHSQLMQVLLERLRTTQGQLSPLLACIAVQALAALGFKDRSLVSQLIHSVPGASPPTPHPAQPHTPPSSAQSNPMHTPPLGAHMQAPSPHTSANTGQPSSPLEAFEHEPLLFSRAAHQSVHNENGTAVPQAPQDSPLPAAYTMGNHPARTEAPRVASTPPDFPGAAESTAVPGSGHQPASFCVPKGLGLHGGTENGGCNSSSSSSSSSSRNSGGGDKLSICASSCAMRNSDMDLSSSSSRSNLGYAKSALSCSNSNSSNSSSRNTSYTESNRSHGGSWEDLTPSMAIRMLCALAELQHRDQGAVRWLTHHALKGTSRWPLLKTPQLPYLTWALAKLQVMEPGAWQSLVANIASSTHAPNAGQVWQPQQLTQVMWALGEAYPGDGLTHVPGWDRAVRGVLQAVEDQLPRFTSRQLLLVMHGVARVRCSLPALPVVDHIALQASRCVARGAYSLDDLLVLLWSSVVAGHASHTLYDAIAEALLPAVDDLQLGGATLAAWCYLRHANYLHPTLTERLLHHCTVLLERGNKQASDPSVPHPGKWGVNARWGGGDDGPPHTERPNLGQQGSVDCIPYSPFHHQHQQEGFSFNSHPKQQHYQQQQQQQQQQWQQQQHHCHGQHQQQAMQQATQAQRPQAEQCSAVLLLTLAASFARCQSNFRGVGALFASVAERAAGMQRHGPLDAAEHEALTHLMAMLGHPHAATAAYPCSPLPLLSSTNCNTTTDGSNARGEQTAYPALPLSLRLTPAFEEGGMGWMQWGGGGGISSWGSDEEGRMYI